MRCQKVQMQVELQNMLLKLFFQECICRWQITESAAEMADDVITNGGFTLLSDYSKCFNLSSGYSPEDIFGILQSSQSNAGTNKQWVTNFLFCLSCGPWRCNYKR
jgi:hypothetical protein